MAGSPPPVEVPKLGMKATVAGLVFALTVLLTFGAATAASYQDSVDHSDEIGEDHADDGHGEDDHGDDHSDDDHADDDHADDDHG